MLEQLKHTQELLTDAMNYNLAMHSAFTSQEDFVDTKLMVNGIERNVQIPTYQYLLSTVDKLSNQVNQLQISDNGDDVMQLLTTANEVQTLYVKKRQQYVNPPKGAKITKFDYETVPTLHSSNSRTIAYVDLSECRLPADAKVIIAKLDNEAPMYLNILNTSTSFDKLANVLSVLEDDYIIIDSNDLEVDDEVQINSALYKVTFADGNRVRLVLQDISTSKPIQATDVIYSITKHEKSHVEVPVAKIHSKLSLAVQYMNLRSVEATYDISFMQNAKHQTEEVSLSKILTGGNLQDTLNSANLAFIKVPAEIEEIVRASKPEIRKITHRQTNSHQYVNSALETLLKTNAVLVQAKNDIDRLHELISIETNYLRDAGASIKDSDEILDLNQQLSSAKTRYYEAQKQLSKLSVSVQQTNPEYIATVYLNPNDSSGLPVLRYVVRYQRLSYNVNDVNVQDWHYIYGDERTTNVDGIVQHTIDDYSQLDNIKIPIRAYEQIAFQVSAVLQYGKPFLTAQSEWSETKFTKLPDELLKEVSIEQMFQNAYAAQLFSNVEQTLTAMGITKHIDVHSEYAHDAQTIKYKDNLSLFEALSDISTRLHSIEELGIDASDIQVYVRYNGILHSVSNGSQIELYTVKSYHDSVIANGDHSDNLGSIAEEDFEILIVNNGTKPVMFHSMFSGSSESTMNIADYANVPIIIDGKPLRQRYGQNHYRSVSNAVNNRDLVLSDFEKIGLSQNLFSETKDNQLLVFPIVGQDSGRNQQHAFIYHADKRKHDVRKILTDYNGIGIHDGYKGYNVFEDTNELENEAKNLIEQFPYDLLNKPFVQTAHTAAFPERTDDTNEPYRNFYLSRFLPEHKYLSGRHTRGAFMFIYDTMLQNITLPTHGTSNAASIDTGVTNAMVIHGKFQSRMTDRLGLTDTNKLVSEGNIVLSNTDKNFSYKKTINVNMQIGIKQISFDVTMEQSMYTS